MPWELMLLLLLLVVVLVRALVKHSRSASASRARGVVEPRRVGESGGVASVGERSGVASRRSALTVAAEIAGIVSAIIAIVALLVSR